MSSSARFEPGDMVELGGPRGGATGEVVTVAADLVTIRVTGDVRPDDVADLVSDDPGAALPEPFRPTPALPDQAGSPMEDLAGG